MTRAFFDQEPPLSTLTALNLVPPGTVVEANGQGEPVELSADNPRLFLCRLHVRETIEQESLDVSLWGSADGSDWGSQPLLKLPQRFYPGLAQMVLDLSHRPEVRFLRARWDVNRWGRGRPLPHFKFDLYLEPVAPA